MTPRPRKRFGQHFLHDPLVIQRIVRAIDPAPGQRIVEIGPGRGAITLPLLERARALHAVELDRDLIPALEERARSVGELTVHNADALAFDFCALGTGERDLRVVGNLPYNISTPLLFHLLGQQQCLEDMHFMLQREVVQRMAAAPGTRAYGRLTVMLAARCATEALFDIGRGAFQPPPQVASSFVRLRPHPEPPFAIRDPAVFARLVTRAFSMRRKTLRNALRGTLEAADIEAAGLDPGARPETLAPDQFAMLANRAAAGDESTDAL